jgi:hypothetical protein
MPRHLSIDEEALTIELTGFLRIGALTRRIRVPWTAVRDVRAGASDAGRGRHGRFRRGRRVQFLSFEDPGQVVRLEIDRAAPGAPPFDDVVVGAQRPGRLAVEVRRRTALLTLAARAA